MPIEVKGKMEKSFLNNITLKIGTAVPLMLYSSIF